MRRIMLILLGPFMCVASVFCQNNPTQTAMPFLRIAPDARSTALGETGVATTPDQTATYWNNAKLSFIDHDFGVAGSYTPWLSNIKSGITSLYFTGYRRMDKTQVLGLAIDYFTLGKVTYADELGNDIGSFNPSEFSIEMAYSKLFGNNFSMGLTGKFLHSDLASGQQFNNADVRAASDFAVDLGFYYQSVNVHHNEDRISYGVVLTNIGPKVSRTSGNSGQYLPMNLRLGTAYQLNGFSSRWNFSMDVNKLLVPTTPIYAKDAYGNNTPVIVAGQDPNRSIPSAIVGSFTDAPGGFSQQIKQFTIAAGAEYVYKDRLFLRSGYHYENKIVSSKRFISAGFGYNGENIHIDFSYLFPTDPISAYQNTYRITFGLNFDN